MGFDKSRGASRNNYLVAGYNKGNQRSSISIGKPKRTGPRGVSEISNQHLKRIFADNELEESSVIKKYLTTAADGKTYNTQHYNLQR